MFIMSATLTKRGSSTAGEINYTTVSTEFGRVLLAAAPGGVCAIFVGDDDAKLAAELQDEFPGVKIVRSTDAQLKRWVAETLASVRNGAKPQIPLEQHGTDFQLRVWRALQSIPRGESKTYSDIAQQIGSPRAVRAVANACAGNRISLLIPCHRVVRRGGGLGGYRWGVHRKQAILDAEQDCRGGMKDG